MKRIAIFLFVAFLSGCGLAKQHQRQHELEQAKKENLAIRDAYDTGKITKQENVDQVAAVLEKNAQHQFDYVYLAYFRWIGSKWIAGEISKEEGARRVCD